MADARPLAVATGDPAGIGPLVAVRAATRATSAVALYGDAERLDALARAEGVDPSRLSRLSPDAPLRVARGAIALVDVARWDEDAIRAHAPSALLGRDQLTSLDHAARAVLDGAARALVTAPTSKRAIELSGTRFTGQTEHLARRAGLAADAVTMLFLGPRLEVALTTTHLALRAVADAITTPRVERAATHLAEALLVRGREGARIAIAGLNPHAGEGGLFGDEEAEVLEPALAALRAREPFRSKRVELVGIVPAETAFRRAADGSLAGIVAMYHDQATIASKLLDWGAAVNVTWGLPFVRTSVDHGVAYDAARIGDGDAGGMIAALAMAEALAR